MHSPDGPISQRHVSPLLATAIFAVPPIFVWVLLRRGYAPSTRRAGFFVCRGEFGLGDDVFGFGWGGQLVRQAPDQVRGALRYAASRLLRMSGLVVAGWASGC